MKRNGKDIFPSGNVGNLGFSLAKGVFALWFIWALVLLSGVGAVVYVVFHFLSKYW